MSKKFKFELGQEVKLAAGGETGQIVGRAEYLKAKDAYVVRYTEGAGPATEVWLNEDAITS